MKSPQVLAVTGLARQGTARLSPQGWPGFSQLFRSFTSSAGKSLSPANHAGEAFALRTPITRLIPGDPAIASQLYAARFGKSAADISGKLGWLKHFAASGKTLHALYAMDVMKDWLPHLHAGMDGERAANGLISLAWDGGQLARASASVPLLLQAINRLTRATVQFNPRTDQGRLLRGAALLSAVTATEGLEHLRRMAHDDLARALDNLIRPDGGHRSGRGDELLRVILFLMPIAAALREARETVPDGLLHGLERMVPMLRMLTLSDRGLTSLHGEAPCHEALAAVFAADQTAGSALEQAPHSALTRVAYGPALLLADDATMNFEFCAEGERIALASIMARRPASQLRPALVHSREGAVLRYEEGLGLRRSVFFSSRGNDLRCEDFLSADECVVIDVPKTVALHPDPTSGGFRLETPGHQFWTGLPRGAVAVIEGHRILLLPDSSTRDGRINWALKRTSA